MIKSKADAKVENRATETIIGQGIRLESTKLTGAESVVINGTFLGDIDLDGFLSVGETGSVIGSIRAKHIDIAGKVRGAIFCDNTVHLKATAFVDGGIATQILRTDEGARLNGQCRMMSEQDEKIALELFEKEGKLNFDFAKLGDTLIPETGLPVVQSGG